MMTDPDTFDGTHECPTTGCPERRPRHILMCRAHWYMVPLFARREVNASWRRWNLHSWRRWNVHRPGARGTPEEAHARRDYMVARKVAVDHVNGKLAKA